MMNKFYYSRTYTFEAQKGARKHYFFNMVERYGEVASFRLTDKDCDAVAQATIVAGGDAETVRFLYRGYEFTLRADRYIAKGYPVNAEGRIEKVDDKLRDAHLHTSNNTDEIKAAEECGCICCQRIFAAEEVENFAEHGVTAICPYCGCDTLIADSAGIKLTKELLSNLNKKYF
ncbi:MAG: hypothetical protein K2M54_01010 [Muribaculaceae bacterium]|nr:hypothetical protein [Muribaculaceae bacterium]